MRLLKHTYIIILLIILCGMGCNKTPHPKWHTTKDGYKLFATQLEDNLRYEWQGDSIDSLANGDGILLVLDGDNYISSTSVYAQYGAVDRTHIIKSKRGIYIGHRVSGEMSGFGCYAKDSGDVYIGNFAKNNPDGYLSWYKASELYYRGNWSKGKISGYGILYEDGTERSGEWRDGELLRGNIEMSIDGNTYKGSIDDNKPNGFGQMLYANGSKYQGGWKSGAFDGEGVLINGRDTIYGEWLDGKLDGYVTFSSDNAWFEGEFRDDKVDGDGRIVLPNSDSYTGEWENGLFSGEGKYNYASEGYYYGEWSNGLQSGLGQYFCDEYEYVGTWEDGWMNGDGRITFPNGDFYEGNIIDNELLGAGYYHFNNNNSYEGEFVDNKFNGLGVFYFEKGDVYEGEFRDGKICGDGTLYFVEGDQTIAITANWDASNKFPNQASILFPNGDLYEGELKDGYPTTNGIWSSLQEREGSSNTLHTTLSRANEFYKKHQDTWDKCVRNTSIVLGIVEVAAPFVATAVAATGVGAPIGAAITGVGMAAGGLNNAIIAADIAVKTASGGLDIYEAVDGGNTEDAQDAAISLGVDFAIDVALIAGPKILKKSPTRRTTIALSNIARSKVRKSVISLSKKQIFGKVAKVTKKNKIYVNNWSSTRGVATRSKDAFHSTYLKTRIAKTITQKHLNEIKTKGGIRLSRKEMAYLQENPAQYRSFIEAKTGNSKNFEEFFIRLNMTAPNQANELLNNHIIREKINSSIRGGKGVHEWLMTKNFQNFLCNPKWGDDGAYLTLSLRKLVQSTKNVQFKSGGGHGTLNSTRFHNGLSKVIDDCNSKEELFVRIRRYAKNVLTKESYKEFNEIFASVLS